ncbi:Protein kinase-like domain [Pseudocohnilembus persalinus]|uniref:Protein kinase-like domain n=1 Tax=Pseudocohnilembus persalinus TaxID=266149 RepID=A0A0V0R8V6_PSEPJ|nr:Protein kinase-like domain [Pseudocohnilembus persalinus]|eukprot:KRX10932.1 Protein kinase-like domain [Pseudocohnilembus persalinus]
MTSIERNVIQYIMINAVDANINNLNSITNLGSFFNAQVVQLDFSYCENAIVQSNQQQYIKFGQQQCQIGYCDGEICDNCISEKDYCTSCINNSYLYKGGVCISQDQCESQFNYFSLENEKLCIKCIIQDCKQCSAYDECEICNDGLFLENHVCVESCPDRKYEKDNICIECPNFCANCQNIQGKPFCTKCDTQYVLQDGECREHCKEGYYQKNQICEECPASFCKSCDSSGMCLECQPNFEYQQDSNFCKAICNDYYQFYDQMDNECKPCQQGCKQCKDLSTCVLCQDNFKYVLQSGICSNWCDKTYQFVSIINEQAYCMNCDKNCQGCENQSDNCKDCYYPKVLNQNNKCVENCDVGYYKDVQNKQCVICMKNCLKCTSKEKCLTCQQKGFFLNDQNQCKECHKSCETCYGPNTDNCIVCSGDLKFQDNMCKQECDQGYEYDKNIEQCYLIENKEEDTIQKIKPQQSDLQIQLYSENMSNQNFEKQMILSHNQNAEAKTNEKENPFHEYHNLYNQDLLSNNNTIQLKLDQQNAATSNFIAKIETVDQSYYRKRFEKIRKLGQGTFGVVDSYYDHQFQRCVAIKKIKFTDENSIIFQQGTKEAEALETANYYCPNVIKIYSCFILQKQYNDDKMNSSVTSINQQLIQSAQNNNLGNSSYYNNNQNLGKCNLLVTSDIQQQHYKINYKNQVQDKSLNLNIKSESKIKKLDQQILNSEEFNRQFDYHKKTLNPIQNDILGTSDELEPQFMKNTNIYNNQYLSENKCINNKIIQKYEQGQNSRIQENVHSENQDNTIQRISLNDEKSFKLDYNDQQKLFKKKLLRSDKLQNNQIQFAQSSTYIKNEQKQNYDIQKSKSNEEKFQLFEKKKTQQNNESQAQKLSRRNKKQIQQYFQPHQLQINNSFNSQDTSYYNMTQNESIQDQTKIKAIANKNRNQFLNQNQNKINKCQLLSSDDIQQNLDTKNTLNLEVEKDKQNQLQNQQITNKINNNFNNIDLKQNYQGNVKEDLSKNINVLSSSGISNQKYKLYLNDSKKLGNSGEIGQKNIEKLYEQKYISQQINEENYHNKSYFNDSDSQKKQQQYQKNTIDNNYIESQNDTIDQINAQNINKQHQFPKFKHKSNAQLQIQYANSIYDIDDGQDSSQLKSENTINDDTINTIDNQDNFYNTSIENQNQIQNYDYQSNNTLQDGQNQILKDSNQQQKPQFFQQNEQKQCQDEQNQINNKNNEVEIEFLQQKENYNKMSKQIIQSNIKQLMLVLELADHSLFDQIQYKRQNKLKFTSFELNNLFQHIIPTIQILHQTLGLAHRDIKPQNILFVNNQYKICDMGVAKSIEATRYITNNHTFTGTLNYIAPEQKSNYILLLQNKSNNNNQYNVFKGDIFSLGLTFYEAITLESIVGLNDNQQKLENAVKNILMKTEEVDKKILYLCKQMLTWDKDERIDSCQLLNIFNYQNNKI